MCLCRVTRTLAESQNGAGGKFHKLTETSVGSVLVWFPFMQFEWII